MDRAYQEATGKLKPEAEDRGARALGGLWLSLGEQDKGFALLREACASKDPGLMILNVERTYDAFRSDPRFKEVLRCAHLE